MKKRFIAILLTGITLFACAFGLSGCELKKHNYRIDFNAELVPYVVKNDFLSENLIKDIYGLDPEVAKDLPKYRTIVIETQEMADEAIGNCSDVDFTKEMIILYIYPSYNEQSRKLKDVHIENGELIITIDFTNKGSGEQPKYWQNRLTIKMDKVEYDTINIRHV